MSDNDTGSSSHRSNNENWCLIESDPAVFTELIELFGCGDLMEVMELYSIEDDSMIQQSLRLIPDLPLFDVASLDRCITDLLQIDCYGLIFLFEYDNAIQRQHGEMMMTDDANDMETSDDVSEAASKNIFFAQQITNNACATQAILSIIMNMIPNGTVKPTDLGSMLSDFYGFTQELPPYYKGMAITSSTQIRNAHNSFTNTNDTFMALNQFDQEKEVKGKGEAFHFVAYVPVNGTVYELDGLQKQPIVVGKLNDIGDDDSNATGLIKKYQWLSIARKAIQDRMAILGADTGDVKFNLMAVTSNRSTSLRRICEAYQDDLEVTATANAQITTLYFAAVAEMQAQEQKRIQYKHENQRRRHNYYNLILNALKELQRMNQLEKCIRLAKEKQHLKQNQQQLKK
jgi:ubiquitin carboxyl-terminal hydrolase L5